MPWLVVRYKTHLLDRKYYYISVKCNKQPKLYNSLKKYGWEQHIFEIIEEWRIKSNLPKNSIFYVCGNLLSEKIVIERNLGFGAKGVSHFEPWNKYKGSIISFEPTNEKYLFLSWD